MDYRKLGDTELEVSTVCLGCWALIGGFTWGDQDEKDSVAAIDAALDAGLNFLDTAPLYGNGASEELLGRTLGARRDGLVLASKVGPRDLEAARVRESCEQSLVRLKTDRIDLLQVHWPNRNVPIEETVGALFRLREQGKVRAIGVSNFGIEDLDAALAVGRIETNQLPYSLLWRAIEFEIQPLCVKRDVGILCYSPLAQGLLTGKFASADDVPKDRARNRLFSKDRPHSRHDEAGCEQAAFAGIAELRKIAAELGQPMGQIALAWLLEQPGVTSVIAGARNPEQACQNVAAADIRLPAETIRRLSAATDAVRAAIGSNADMWQAGDEARIR